jgi:hypothetical protein
MQNMQPPQMDPSMMGMGGYMQQPPMMGQDFMLGG